MKLKHLFVSLSLLFTNYLLSAEIKRLKEHIDIRAICYVNEPSFKYDIQFETKVFANFDSTYKSHKVQNENYQIEGFEIKNYINNLKIPLRTLFDERGELRPYIFHFGETIFENYKIRLMLMINIEYKNRFAFKIYYKTLIKD